MVIPVKADWQNNPFIRGDVDQENLVTEDDAYFILNWQYGNGEAPKCLDSADWNDDGMINLADVIGILIHANSPKGGGYSIEPDYTPDDLDCESYTIY